MTQNPSAARRLVALSVGLLTAGLSLTGCSGEVTPAVVAGVDACAHCNMVIDQVNQAAGWIENGEFVPFDSPGCLLAEHDERRKGGETPPDDLFFADFQDAFFHPAATVAFLLTTHQPTVMGSGALAFGTRPAAEATREHDDEIITDWVGYRTARGTPDREVEVSFGSEGMVPDRVELEKGELVAWTARNAGEEGELALTIKGYPELEPILIAAGEEPVSFRLLASRPGSGFPIIESGSGEVLGVVVVHGAHTSDEEAEGL